MAAEDIKRLGVHPITREDGSMLPGGVGAAGRRGGPEKTQSKRWDNLCDSWHNGTGTGGIRSFALQRLLNDFGLTRDGLQGGIAGLW